jgi:hypothetical protein
MITQAADVRVQILVFTSGMMGADWLFGRWFLHLGHVSVHYSHFCKFLLTIVNGSDSDRWRPSKCGMSWAISQFKHSNCQVPTSQRSWRLTEPNHVGFDSIRRLHDLMAYACTSGEETVYLHSRKQISDISFHHGTTSAFSLQGSIPKTGYCVRYRHDLQWRFL